MGNYFGLERDYLDCWSCPLSSSRFYSRQSWEVRLRRYPDSELWQLTRHHDSPPFTKGCRRKTHFFCRSKYSRDASAWASQQWSQATARWVRWTTSWPRVGHGWLEGSDLCDYWYCAVPLFPLWVEICGSWHHRELAWRHHHLGLLCFLSMGVLALCLGSSACSSGLLRKRICGDLWSYSWKLPQISQDEYPWDYWQRDYQHNQSYRDYSR